LVAPAYIAVLLALAATGISCRSGPPHAIDPALAECVPPGATILAGVNLVRLRASPLHRQLPPAALAFLAPLDEANALLVASDGTNYLAVTHGSFRQAPSGATLLTPGLAAAGSTGWLRAAESRQHGHGGGATPLLERAGPVAAASDIWMVAAGNADLPLSGNGDNLNRLLHATEYATLSVRLTDRIDLEVVGVCRGPGPARQLEETVRAFLTLSAAGTARQPGISGLLRRVRLSRNDRAIHLALEAQPAELEPLSRLF
jgi:hypothetical protein